MFFPLHCWCILLVKKLLSGKRPFQENLSWRRPSTHVVPLLHEERKTADSVLKRYGLWICSCCTLCNCVHNVKSTLLHRTLWLGRWKNALQYHLPNLEFVPLYMHWCLSFTCESLVSTLLEMLLWFLSCLYNNLSKLIIVQASLSFSLTPQNKR